MQDVLFGAPNEPALKVSASPVPLAAHLSLVLIAGLYLPPGLIGWLQRAAELLG
jgi:hydrogenase-4 component F